MSGKTRNLILLPILVFALMGRGSAATLLGSITITGTEVFSGGVWDTGTVTVTINGLSVWYSYGQFSTPASVASALGAIISNYCGYPVYAQANGAILNFYKRGSNVISAANIAATSNIFPSSSFQIGGLPNLYPPVINAISLSEGPPGMGIQITGQYFGAGGSVSIGGVAPTIIAWTPNTITVQIPPGLAPGTLAPVTVTTWTINIGQHFNFRVDAPFGCN